MQKLWPQTVVTGLRNTSRQMGQRTWSSNLQRLLLFLSGSWPCGGLEGWAGAGTWSWTGSGETEESHVEA